MAWNIYVLHLIKSWKHVVVIMHICTVHLQVRRLVEIVEGGCQPEGSQHQQ